MPSCDLLILTAANFAQARLYRSQLAARKHSLAAAGIRDWAVIPDPKGTRVGSGAATILALLHAARHFATPGTRSNPFAGRNTLILHSGGDSRRLPAYAARGKIFAPTPCITRSGQAADLFDLVLEDFLSLAWPSDGRTIIAAGDLLLNISRHTPDLSHPGITALACPSDTARASRHGVYITRPGTTLVRDFLQKPDAATLKAHHAFAADGSVAVDTGVLSLDASAASSWLAAAGIKPDLSIPADSLTAQINAAACAPMDLYVHSIMAITPGISAAAYATQIASAATIAQRTALTTYRTKVRAARTPFRAICTPCDFVHIGTTREFIHAALNPAQYRSLTPDRTDPRLLNTPSATITGEGSIVVEGSHAITLNSAADALVAGIDRPCSISLPPATGLSCIELANAQSLCIAFGLDDDCKTTLERGGTFASFKLAELAAKLGIAETDLWPQPSKAAASTERSLWTARLWRIGPRRRVIAEAQSLLQGKVPSRSWMQAPRMALADILSIKSVPPRRAAASIDIVAQLKAGARPDLAAAARQIRAGSAAAAARRDLAAFVASAPHPFAQARALRMLAHLGTRRTDPGDAPLAAVRRGVEQTVLPPLEPARAAIAPGATITATAPVRIDLAGGWSDTPPICHEQGGIVINMAVLLEGRAPIRASVRRIDEPLVRIRSVDLGRVEEWTTAAGLCDYDDPSDWAALAKASLVLSGLVPSVPSSDLAAWLMRVGGGQGGGEGGGIELTLEAAVPKGSGIGTSSVLAATVLAALDGFKGIQKPMVSELVRKTMLLEQMMSTCGGWQDQCGGLMGGIKCISTQAGDEQSPCIEPLKLGPSCSDLLIDRGVLCFTGVQRLAKNILRNVVYRYLDGQPRCGQIVQELRAGALAMRRAIERDEPDGLLASLQQYWSLKREIDPGAFDARLARRLSTLLPHAAALELPGAGGGGFAFMLCPSAKAKKRLHAAIGRLTNENPAVRAYEWSMAPALGLKVTLR
jgi:fucokinase